ncbi:IS4 family transposase [Umezawaea tangerina]|uniref:IS4 family transposase n=1 Tax=Umezawaea tangerina TaxID=84725 RepID=A0A2T0T6N7_9PSEU|nr:IS4 family transposase [Umezawaea tangerina]
MWDLVDPLIPVPPRRTRNPGRKRLPDCPCLQGILFVLHTGIGWEHLPRELGFGSGMTCWRRLRDWSEAGVWQRLHEVMLAGLREADRIDWFRAVVDSSHVRALEGGRAPAPSAVDRGRVGSKHHLITDGGGIPLAVILTGGNSHDITRLLPLVDAIPQVRGKRGRPRRRPDTAGGPRLRQRQTPPGVLRRRGITPVLARRRTRTGPGWEPCAGSSNAATPGCTSSGACASAGNAASTSTKRSSSWPAH